MFHTLVQTSHQESVFWVSLPRIPKTLVFWVRGYPKHGDTQNTVTGVSEVPRVFVPYWAGFRRLDETFVSRPLVKGNEDHGYEGEKKLRLFCRLSDVFYDFVPQNFAIFTNQDKIYWLIGTGNKFGWSGSFYRVITEVYTEPGSKPKPKLAHWNQRSRGGFYLWFKVRY